MMAQRTYVESILIRFENFGTYAIKVSGFLQYFFQNFWPRLETEARPQHPLLELIRNYAQMRNKSECNFWHSNGFQFEK